MIVFSAYLPLNKSSFCIHYIQFDYIGLLIQFPYLVMFCRGQYCGFSPADSVVLNDDPCSQHDCQNEALCRSLESGGRECRCLDGFSGEQCEKVNILFSSF